MLDSRAYSEPHGAPDTGEQHEPSPRPEGVGAAADAGTCAGTEAGTGVGAEAGVDAGVDVYVDAVVGVGGGGSGVVDGGGGGGEVGDSRGVDPSTSSARRTGIGTTIGVAASAASASAADGQAAITASPSLTGQLSAIADSRLPGSAVGRNGRTYAIETFGCQMNVHDSERMSGLLEADGYRETSSTDDADVVVINTCSVREHAARKLFTRLGEIRAHGEATGRRPVVAVAGCVAQQDGGDILKRSPLVDVIIGTQAVKQLPELVARAAGGTRQPLVDLNPYEDVSFPLGVTRRDDPVRAYVTIIEGCNDFCAFCVVPYTRGHERMRPLAEILAEVRQAAETGRQEVHLLGQIVNHYQAPDAACDFAGLLEQVHAIEGITRIRFASPHPRHVTDSLIDAYRRLPKICRHLHLPVQSGSTRILQAMRRRYTRESYLALIARIREALPDIALTTDMIVGFPGETEADFEDTLSLARAVRFHGMYSFKYSPRPKTLAGKRMLDDVSEREKSRRIVMLQQEQREIQIGLFEAMVGSVVPVLVDGVSRRRDYELAGRTSGNTIVNFPGDASWVGRTLDIRITEAGANAVRGEAVV